MPGFVPPKMPVVRSSFLPVGERGVDPGDRGSPRWLARLTRGIDLSLYGFVATLFGSAADYYCFNWRSAPAWLLWISSAIPAIGFVAFGVGAWLLTTPDPEPPADQKIRRAAVVVRVILAASYIIFVAAVIQHLVVGGLDRSRVRLAALIVIVLLDSIGFAAGLNYLRLLGRRLGETTLRRNARMMMIAVEIPFAIVAIELAIAGICQRRSIKMNDALTQLFLMLRLFCVIAAAVLTVFYTVVLERFRRRLSQRQKLAKNRLSV